MTLSLGTNVLRRALAACVLAVTLTLAGTVPGLAQSINDILSKGKIVVGVLVDFPPFGILNERQEPDGYDIELAKLMGKYLGVEVEIVPMTTANRSPLRRIHGWPIRKLNRRPVLRKASKRSPTSAS